jgi:ATP-dependent DNA helicase DinG
MFIQGSGARSRLLDDFRRAGNGILLGTGSFWQGVDVRGPALRLVVIDKLPFAVPSDPLIQARIESIRRQDGEPFMAFQLPEAVLALKQGVGRLIRDFDDRGLVVLGDPRLRSKSYGRIFLDSLPPFARIDDDDEAVAFAETLSRGGETAEAAASA